MAELQIPTCGEIAKKSRLIGSRLQQNVDGLQDLRLVGMAVYVSHPATILKGGNYHAIYPVWDAISGQTQGNLRRTGISYEIKTVLA